MGSLIGVVSFYNFHLIYLKLKDQQERAEAQKQEEEEDVEISEDVRK